ncbi:hypothetical protein Tco_1432161, partial [Tanacetum coccineum]
TARTTGEGEVEITTSIDGQVKTITEASLRRQLKLEDSDGINSLPNTEIFEQLALMGYVSDSARLTFQKVDFPLFPTMITTPESSPSRITFSPSLSPQSYQSPQSSPPKDITRQDAEIPQSQFPTQTQVADEAAFISVDVDTRGAATTDIGFGKPVRGSVLENEIQQTKKVYSSALTKLILRVKKLEKKVKTNKAKRKAKIVISEDECAFLRSSAKLNLSSSSNLLPSCALVKKNMISEFAEALTPL